MAIASTPYSEDRVQLVIVSGPRTDVGRKLATWTEYEFTEDLFTAANHFSFKLSLSGAGNDMAPEEYIEKVCELTLPDSVVQLELNGTLLSTGIIEDQFITEDENGEAFIEISGMDPAMVLLANEVEPTFKIKADTTLPDLAEQMLKPYRGHGINFEVVADDLANRSLLTGRVIQSGKTVQTSRGRAAVQRGDLGPSASFAKTTLADAQPHPAETEWDFIHRHAENLGVIPYMTADGDLTFIVPDYDQEELYAFTRIRNGDNSRTNIISGGRRRSMANAATSVHVVGRGSLYRSNDPRNKEPKKPRKKKPPISAIARTNMPFVWPRRRYIRDNNAWLNAEAQKIANRELAHRNANGIVYDYMVAGHTSRRGYRFSCNTMAHIYDELMRPTDDLSAYMTKRVVRKARKAATATSTSVTLVPKGAIVL